jgi:glucokinase
LVAERTPRSPSLPLRTSNYGLGIDLGGTSVKVVAVTPAGKLLARFTESFNVRKRLHFAEVIRSAAKRAQAEQGRAARFLGLAAPGLAARDGRSIAFMPGRLAGLEGLAWTDYLRFPRRIPVLNDAHAALLGEVWRGAARGCQNVILLTLGTGVGGAAMVDGHLLHGHNGRAGHLGHVSLDPNGLPDICSAPGSLEDAIGNHNIATRSHGRFTTTRELIRAQSSGDEFAKAVWLKSVRALAAAIASFINVLDPEVVIIGGGIAQAGEVLFRPLQRFLDRMEWRPTRSQARIVPAVLGEFAGAIGAARNAMSQRVGTDKRESWVDRDPGGGGKASKHDDVWRG